MFVQSMTSDLFTYKVVTIDEDGQIYETLLTKQRFNYHFIQPLDTDKLLVVGATTRYYSPNNYELNGKIFDLNGNLIKELLLGDGIQNVQVSTEGIIWTGYFDEGVRQIFVIVMHSMWLVNMRFGSITISTFTWRKYLTMKWIFSILTSQDHQDLLHMMTTFYLIEATVNMKNMFY